MKRSVFNKGKEVRDLKQQRIMVEDVDEQRYDTMKYTILEKLTQQKSGDIGEPEEE